MNSASVRDQFEDDHPFTSDEKTAAKNEDKFMLIPSIGYETNDLSEQFVVTLNGWYYEPLKPGLIQTLIKSGFRKTLGYLDPNSVFTKEQQNERMGPFFVRDVKNHQIELRLSDSISKTVRTDDNGRFHERITVNTLKGVNVKDEVLTYVASDDDHNQQGDQGSIYLMKKRSQGGCSIISDIDDTIKISEVPNKQRLMVNTFNKDFQAVPGMADLYQIWRSSHGCQTHYVSAMPSQLYYATQKFLDKEKFPRGSFHMRHLKLASADKYNLAKKVLDFIKHDASQKHKLTAIEHILEHAPSTQQFIMVGDSGELDPEIYGQIARKYSNRIKIIFIRLVEGGGNERKRFATAFKDVPSDKWNTFANATDLPRTLYEDIDHRSSANSANQAFILSTSASSIILYVFITQHIARTLV